jgi:hypothetical protein
MSRSPTSKRSIDDLYNKDLGTMGIPRDVVNMRNDQNFLFAGQIDTGPGSYNPG